MIITKIEAVNKTKYKVYVEGQFTFALYKGELSRYHLKEEGEVPEETVEKIKKDIVLKRAKLRTMHLLDDMDRTEFQLRTKLRQNHYTDDIIEAALAYVKSFGYINDEAYIRRFIDSRRDKKSRKELYALLCQKGLDRGAVDEALNAAYEGCSEEDTIRGIVRKKHWDLEAADAKDKQKFYGYLLRKGFKYEEICRIIAR